MTKAAAIYQFWNSFGLTAYEENSVPDDVNFKVRLIDCVGYIVKGALGYLEEDEPKMVNTPWYEYEIPFEDAAEIGTRKVITDHSTIGLLVTTDGSITGLSREDYVEAEERVVEELKSINKPFVVVLNTKNINSPESPMFSNFYIITDFL